MNFRVADTFTDSLAKLTGDEQKAVKTTAFDLQMDRAEDKKFWSVRVSSDLRMIVIAQMSAWCCVLSTIFLYLRLCLASLSMIE